MPSKDSSFSQYLKKNHLAILSVILAFLSLPFLAHLFTAYGESKKEQAVARISEKKSATGETNSEIITTHRNRVDNSVVTNNGKVTPAPPVQGNSTSGLAGVKSSVKMATPALFEETPATVSAPAATVEPPIKNEAPQSNVIQPQYEKAIIIMGHSNDLILRKASGTTPFTGYKIVGSGTNKILYIPKGQPIHIIIRGHNNDIIAKDGLAEFIMLDESGNNNSIKED